MCILSIVILQKKSRYTYILYIHIYKYIYTNIQYIHTYFFFCYIIGVDITDTDPGYILFIHILIYSIFNYGDTALVHTLLTLKDQMFMRPPTPPDARARPSGLKARVLTGVM